MIVRITLSYHNLSFKQNLLCLIIFFLLSKDISDVQETLSKDVV